MDYDEWFFNSIKRYKNLSMYDLQHKITCMDMVDGKSICVATTSTKRNEIMELMLPDKMIDIELEARLKKDRDFRVNCGGFCDDQMSKCRHIPKTRYCAVTLENQHGTVSIFQMGTDNTDLMQPYTSYRTSVTPGQPIHLTSCTDSDEHITFGSALDNITVADIHNKQPLYSSSNCSETEQVQVTAIYQDNPDIVTCCSVKGNISVLDFRCSKVKVSSNKNSGKPASFWTMSQPSSQSHDVLQLSCKGEVLLMDTRCPKEHIVSAELPVSTNRDLDLLQIQESPGKEKFSVSGFDGLVYIFDHPNNHQKEDILEPVFKHEGHVMECESQSDDLKIIQHLWHPWQSNLIISCADNGTIHAWQYNE